MLEFSSFSTDWTRNYKGGSLVCFPSNTSQVSNVLKYCNDNNIGLHDFISFALIYFLSILKTLKASSFKVETLVWLEVL